MRAGRERAQRNLYVLNLPLDATTDQFEALFGQFGSVEHAVILATLDHLARRRGFILMADHAQATAAIQRLNGHEWHHYRIEVSFAIVQRSGTPFCHDVEPRTDDEASAKVNAADTVNQHLEQKWTYEPGLAPVEVQGARRANDTTLLLSCLDTSIVTSSAMVRALTEPFGHIVELRQYQQRDDPIDRARASIEYCCCTSASLAQLSLHGLVVGASKVHATVVGTRPSVVHSASHGEKDNAAAFALSSTGPADQLELDNTEQSDALSYPLPPSGLTPRQSDAITARGSLALQPRDCCVDDARLGAWRDRSTSNTSAVKHDKEEPILVDRVSPYPCPLGLLSAWLPA